MTSGVAAAVEVVAFHEGNSSIITSNAYITASQFPQNLCAFGTASAAASRGGSAVLRGPEKTKRFAFLLDSNFVMIFVIL
jgi:hypothetical protein